MRVYIFVLACVAAFLSSAYAAPLAVTTVIDIPPFFSSVTLVLDLPTEIPNPLPSTTANGASPIPTGTLDNPASFLQAASLIADLIEHGGAPDGGGDLPLPIHRRGAGDFREADYGVSPDDAFDSFAPIAGLAVTPSASAHTSAHSRRSDDDDPYWDARYGVNEPSQDATPSPTGILDTSGAGASNPLAVLNNIQSPQPDLSPGFIALSNGMQSASKERYDTSYEAHHMLGALFGTGQTTTADAAKASQNVHNEEGAIQRRDLAPARYVTLAPVRRAAQFVRELAGGVKHFISRHSIELSSEPLLPSPVDPNLNMSDPATAYEVLRKQNVGLLNVDSNRPPPPPQPSHAAATVHPHMSFNATKGGHLDDSAMKAMMDKAKPKAG